MLHWNYKGMDGVGVPYFCSVIALMNVIFLYHTTAPYNWVTKLIYIIPGVTEQCNIIRILNPKANCKCT